MNKILTRSAAIALSITSTVFTFFPETIFGAKSFIPIISAAGNVAFNRVMTLIVVFILSLSGYALYTHCRKRITIKGHNYSIIVEYGDLFSMCSCKKVINFDECFTTTIGESPGDIKPGTVCGQYLQKFPMQDYEMQDLITKTQLKPSKDQSKYKNKTKYDSGLLVPNGEFLLLAFAKLDKDGKGWLTRDEYINCLSLLWSEIDKYFNLEDVCIPILGSGITRLNDELLMQQELLDIIIESYKLNSRKIKLPYKLHIICKKIKDIDFSLNKIGKSI